MQTGRLERANSTDEDPDDRVNRDNPRQPRRIGHVRCTSADPPISGKAAKPVEFSIGPIRDISRVVPNLFRRLSISLAVSEELHVRRVEAAGAVAAEVDVLGKHSAITNATQHVSSSHCGLRLGQRGRRKLVNTVRHTLGSTVGSVCGRMIHAFQPVVLELQVHAECLNSDRRLGVMSESGHEVYSDHVRCKSANTPIADQ